MKLEVNYDSYWTNLNVTTYLGLTWHVAMMYMMFFGVISLFPAYVDHTHSCSRY